MDAAKWGLVAVASVVTLVGVGYLVTPTQSDQETKAMNPTKKKLADIALEITRIADSLRGSAIFTKKQLVQLSEELMQHQLTIDSLQTEKYAHLKRGLTKEIHDNFKIVDLKIKEFVS